MFNTGCFMFDPEKPKVKFSDIPIRNFGRTPPLLVNKVSIEYVPFGNVPEVGIDIKSIGGYG